MREFRLSFFTNKNSKAIRRVKKFFKDVYSIDISVNNGVPVVLNETQYTYTKSFLNHDVPNYLHSVMGQEGKKTIFHMSILVY